MRIHVLTAIKDVSVKEKKRLHSVTFVIFLQWYVMFLNGCHSTLCKDILLNNTCQIRANLFRQSGIVGSYFDSRLFSGRGDVNWLALAFLPHSALSGGVFLGCRSIRINRLRPSKPILGIGTALTQPNACHRVQKFTSRIGGLNQMWRGYLRDVLFDKEIAYLHWFTTFKKN